ncbi:hypothetical protein BS47DRAFT_1392190 [Hydnum rufescens UP504]|uniref:DUF7918 domain-containing protein n=1 Tax=Hydnum rufescens UP504 TaxID=1448309 RepID=A0A9P6AZ92_9AGAM|nr:hypothetical protein BS47DRAFT_1392190 [Hydnum rufescens UP504]
MVRVPGCDVSITIQCEGEDLSEYSHEVRGNSATCYIPSVEGKHFQICVMRAASKTSFCVQVYFDGQNAAMHIDFRRSKRDKKRVGDSVRVNQSLKRRLVFSQLKLTDDEDALAATSGIDTNALGTIRVNMRHVIQVPVRSSDSRGIGTSNEGAVHSGTVHERAKKSGGHIVSKYTHLDTLHQPSAVTLTFRHTVEHLLPIVPSYDLIGCLVWTEVTFRYAPYDVLRAREIIPSPPAPPRNASPSSGDGRTASNAPPPAKAKREREEVDGVSDQSGFSDEEEARTYARLKAKKMAKRSGLAKIKIEENGIPTGIFKYGEVIDLTEDD